MSTFSIDRPFLQELLREIGNGKIQLPDFQRDWVWNDDRIRSLIASVSREFPIGSVLTLKAEDTDVRFETRLIEGVNPADVRKEPDTLILDGQQRLTALFQVLVLGNVVFRKTARGRQIRRYYYFDMEACLRNETDREDAVISCREGRPLQLATSNGKTKTIDLSLTEAQYDHHIFPAHKIFDSADWKQGYIQHWNQDAGKIQLLFKFDSEIIQRFNQYNVPAIELSGAPKEAVCLVFEKVNTGGVTLTVFELLTASLAAENFRLRDDWELRQKRLRKHKVLGRLDGINFLQALTLVATKNKNAAVSCKRKEILELDRECYKDWADQIEAGFVKAARFLHRQKIFNAKDVPYSAQLVPLTAILTDLGNLNETEEVQRKIARWYWCGVLGEVYAGSTDTQAARDFSEVTNWIKEGSKEPTTIHEADFQEKRLPELRTRGSALYKGIHALIMHDRGTTQCGDFRTGIPIDEKIFFDDRIDIHHIFPRAWCERQGIPPKVYNSIINKTAISARTNQQIGGRAPSEYLQKIQDQAGIDAVKMDERLAAHLISAEALRVDNFCGFFEARKAALLDIIKKAMGKEKVIRESREAAEEPAEAKEFKEFNESTAGEVESRNEHQKSKSWRKGLIVIFPDGTVFSSEKDSSNQTVVWVKTIQKLLSQFGVNGFMAADRKARRHSAKDRIISTDSTFRDAGTRTIVSTEHNENCITYFITHDYRAERKKELLDSISNILGAGLKVEVSQ